MDAEALMPRRQEMLDRLQRRGLDQVDHHRRRQHRDAPGADKRRRMLGGDHEFGRAEKAGADAGEVEHGATSYQRYGTMRCAASESQGKSSASGASWLYIRSGILMMIASATPMFFQP